MTSKDGKQSIECKYENGSGCAKMDWDLSRLVSKQTINLWIKMIIKFDSTNLSKPADDLCIIRIESKISKAKSYGSTKDEVIINQRVAMERVFNQKNNSKDKNKA